MQSLSDYGLLAEQISNELTYTRKNVFMDDLIEQDEVLSEYFDVIHDEIKICEKRGYTKVLVEGHKDYDVCIDKMARKIMYMLMECPKASIQQFVGMLLHSFEGEMLEALDMADTLMTRLADTDVLDFQPKYDGLNVIANFHLHKDTQAELGVYDKPLPSIAPLNEIRRNFDQAYHTLSTGSVILGKSGLKHHDQPIDYLAINTAQSIPFSLDEDFAMATPYVKDHSGIHPKARSMAILNFEYYVKKQFKVHGILIEQGNKFYLPHKRDARLRSNAQGKFVNYQKDAFHKACLDFTDCSTVTGFN